MKLYFVSDTGRTSVSCAIGLDHEIIRVMALWGYHETTRKKYQAQAKNMRNAERRDDSEREREEVRFKNECRG
jgi:hypothetical protein